MKTRWSSQGGSSSSEASSRCVLIPVRQAGKTRLSHLLSRSDRNRLINAMLLDVALAAAEAVGPANVFILYKPPGTPQLPEELGVRVIRDRTGTLNEALAAGQELVEREGFRSLLILHADLPLIEPRDVVRMFEATSKLRPPSALITPSKDGGTNALLLTPPRALEPRYGPGSFNRHLNQALEQGVRVRIYRSPPVETDIDSEKDLAALLRWPKVTHAKKLLLELSAKGRPGIERRVAF